jgi:hypothetical protein
VSFSVGIILVPGDAALLAEAVRRWPGARGRLNCELFGGIAICSDDVTNGSYEEMERKHTLMFEMRDGLPEFSLAHASVPFVFLEADCFAGRCRYEGYLCRDGEILRQESAEYDEDPTAFFNALLSGLGASVATAHFEPLTRDYFD